MPTSPEFDPPFVLAPDTELGFEGTTPDRLVVLYDYPALHQEIIFGYLKTTNPNKPIPGSYIFFEYRTLIPEGPHSHMGMFLVLSCIALADDPAKSAYSRVAVKFNAPLPGQLLALTSAYCKHRMVL